MKKSKCLCCKGLFDRDRRNYWKQEYCLKPECRKESKKQSQKRWFKKPENKDFFRGPENVQRVRDWRKRNPFYWKRVKRKIPLQDLMILQPLTGECVKKKRSFALQDFIRPQIALLIGIIAQLSGHALQDDIIITVQKMIQRGMQILNPKPP